MKDYSLREALNIFGNVNPSSILHLKFHFQKNSSIRHKNPNLWNDSFFGHRLLGLMKQEENKFKLCYKHPRKSQKDLYLVVAINEDDSMDLITTYEASINGRKGENEWR